MHITSKLTFCISTSFSLSFSKFNRSWAASMNDAKSLFDLSRGINYFLFPVYWYLGIFYFILISILLMSLFLAFMKLLILSRASFNLTFTISIFYILECETTSSSLFFSTVSRDKHYPICLYLFIISNINKLIIIDKDAEKKYTVRNQEFL